MHEQGRLSAGLRAASNSNKQGPRSGPTLGSYGPDGLLFVPSTHLRRERYPLLVMLHGATYGARDSIEMTQAAAKEHDFIVFAPKSQSKTWDLIVERSFGRDFNEINDAIESLPDLYPIDPDNIAIGGFSDGASYALTLGLLNGHIFRNILAFSPGFFVGDRVLGHPRIYISHGRHDPVLPYDGCGSALASTLTTNGYDVRFDPFEGGHEVPLAQVAAAAYWWLRN